MTLYLSKLSSFILGCTQYYYGSTTGVNVIKLFFFADDGGTDKLEQVLYKKRVLVQNKSNLLLKIILYNT